MGKIRILSEEVVSKIAAGEVIERPASAVKELIENSIDSGATRIIIQIENGGKSLIRVADDGEGMSPEDALLCFQHHATSKIQRVEDLQSIETLGFRGEALPSIATVSRFRILTCDGQNAGFEVFAEAGKVQKTRGVGLPRGTTAEVQDLFFNLPARRKFLKSDSVEYSHILKTVQLYALSFSSISFTLQHNGKRTFFTPGKGLTPDLLRWVFDRDVAQSMAFFHFETEAGQGKGFMSSPAAYTQSAKDLYFFVNRRPVRSSHLISWVKESARYILPEGKVPYLVLFLTLPPEKVDVNVHPAKLEVHFTTPGEVRSLVVNTLREGMIQRSRAPAIPPGSAEPLPVSEKTPSSSTDFSLQAHKPPFPGQESPVVRFPVSFRVLGQVFDTFIAIEEGEEFLLVDQHVASERVLFEALTSGKKVPSQELLISHPLTLTEPEQAVVEENLMAFERVGIRVQKKEKEVVITALPFYLTPSKAGEQIQEAIQQILSYSSLSLTYEEEKWRALACKLAVKANTPLSVREMERLYRAWKETRHPFTCPHGRPISFRVSKDEMYRKVGRT